MTSDNNGCCNNPICQGYGKPFGQLPAAPALEALLDDLDAWAERKTKRHGDSNYARGIQATTMRVRELLTAAPAAEQPAAREHKWQAQQGILADLADWLTDHEDGRVRKAYVLLDYLLKQTAPATEPARNGCVDHGIKRDPDCGRCWDAMGADEGRMVFGKSASPAEATCDGETPIAHYPRIRCTICPMGLPASEATVPKER